MSQSNLASTLPNRAARRTKANNVPSHNASSHNTPSHLEIQQAIAQLTRGDFHQKWDSVKQLSAQFIEWGDRAIPPLIEQLQTETDPENQGFLIRLLSQFNRPAVIEAIATLLVETNDPDVQTEATKALTKIGTNAIQTLSKQLNSSSTSQQILAAKALSRIRRTPVIEPLLGIANHPEPELRAIAIEALGSFHDPRITPILIAATQDEPTISKEAIRTLGRRSDLIATVDIIAPLSQALQSPSTAIAKESAIALGRLGTTAAVSSLAHLLSQPKPTPVKIAAVRALGWNRSRLAVEALAEAFGYNAIKLSLEAKLEIARSLGQVRADYLKPIAAEQLVHWLTALQDRRSHSSANAIDEFNNPLVQTVILSLARLGSTDAIEPLIKLLSDADARIRMHARSALRQIDPNNKHLLPHQ